MIDAIVTQTVAAAPAGYSAAKMPNDIAAGYVLTASIPIPTIPTTFPRSSSSNEEGVSIIVQWGDGQKRNEYAHITIKSVNRCWKAKWMMDFTLHHATQLSTAWCSPSTNKICPYNIRRFPCPGITTVSCSFYDRNSMSSSQHATLDFDHNSNRHTPLFPLMLVLLMRCHQPPFPQSLHSLLFPLAHLKSYLASKSQSQS